MHPDKVSRDRLVRLTDLPSIGPAMARDFVRMGFDTPRELVGADPVALYRKLCEMTASYHDPCVLDTFMAVTDFLAGAAPRPWWAYTAKRQERHADVTAAMRERYARPD